MRRMKIWESSFEDLNVDHRGAGFALSNKCNLSLRFDKFVRCRTTANEGGGFYADVKKISISCVIFIECYSPDEGSAFHITSQCESSKIQESTIARSRGFEQDGFISYGRIENSVHNSNVSECSGRDSALTNWPKSEATSRYFFMNIFEVSTTSQGIFWTYSKVRIEDSNIIRCQTTHLVGIQYGSGATLSFCRNVIIDGKFDQFYSSPLTEKDRDTATDRAASVSLSVEGNVFSSEELKSFFQIEGSVVSKPNTVKFGISQECLHHTRKLNNEVKMAFALILVLNIFLKF